MYISVGRQFESSKEANIRENNTDLDTENLAEASLKSRYIVDTSNGVEVNGTPKQTLNAYSAVWQR